jgi:ribosomal protein S2
MAKQVLLPPARQIEDAITKPAAQPIDSPQITNRFITSKLTAKAIHRIRRYREISSFGKT